MKSDTTIYARHDKQKNTFSVRTRDLRKLLPPDDPQDDGQITTIKVCWGKRKLTLLQKEQGKPQYMTVINGSNLAGKKQGTITTYKKQNKNN